MMLKTAKAPLDKITTGAMWEIQTMQESCEFHRDVTNPLGERVFCFVRNKQREMTMQINSIFFPRLTAVIKMKHFSCFRSTEYLLLKNTLGIK